MTSDIIVKWLLSMILAVTLTTGALVSFGIKQQQHALQQVMEEATNASIAREDKLDTVLRAHIERSTERLWRSLYDYQQDDLERIRRAVQLEQARQLHGHTRQAFGNKSHIGEENEHN